MTATYAFLIPRSLCVVFFIMAGGQAAHAAKSPISPAPQSCAEAVAAAQRYGFYEGLAVLAESNLEKFFIPQYRLAVHSQILKDENQLTFPKSPWWIPEGGGAATFAEPPSENEMDQIMTFRSMSPADMSEEELSLHMALEKKLHRALFKIHQDGLTTYRDWAFEAFPPLRAYQRVFENYVSSSVWWNNYVSEYARTLAGIYHEQNTRSDCPREMLWTSLND